MSEGRSPYLVLFGQLAWKAGASFEPIPFGRPARIVVALAERQPGWISVDELIDLLWTEPPARANNALQRHVSRLRKYLQQLDPNGTAGALESSAAGYRLGPQVRSDLSVLRTLLDDEPLQVEAPGSDFFPQWWTDPLVGEVGDEQSLLRSTLEAGAHQLRDRWISQSNSRVEHRAAADFLVCHLTDNPSDRLAARSLLAIAEIVEDADVCRRAGDMLSLLVHDRGSAMSDLADRVSRLNNSLGRPRASSHVDYRTVSPVAAAWVARDLEGALRLLDALAPDIPSDVERRLKRCLKCLSPTDPWALFSWQDLVSLSDLTAELAEKMLVSLDAYALEQTTDSLCVADEEVQSADGVADVVRALRVRFMVGLGHPLSHAQTMIPEQLAAIDDADAQTEALRYRGILASKAGEFEQSEIHFDQYARLRDLVWPDTVDDFDQLARFIHGQAKRELLDQEQVVAVSVLPIVTNQIVVEMTMLWVYLSDGTTISDNTLDQMLRSTVSAAQPECGLAFELLRLLSLEAPARPDDDRLRLLAEDLLKRVVDRPQNRNQHAALVVIAQVACLVRDQDLARGVLELLRPWAGEQLGIWPMDVIFCPADDVISKLDGLLSGLAGQ